MSANVEQWNKNKLTLQQLRELFIEYDLAHGNESIEDVENDHRE